MRINKFVIPILVVMALFGGYFLRSAFTQPTTNVAYEIKDGAKAAFIVDGLKCKGTAAFFTSLYDSIPGIIGIETFATEHKAVIAYVPDKIGIDSIKTIMEQKITFDDGTSEQVFVCRQIDKQID